MDEIEIGDGSDDFKADPEFKKGEFLFKEGQLVTGFFIIKKGEVVSFKQNSARIIPISYSKAQDMVGVESLFNNDDRYHYTALCMEKTQVVEVSRNEVLQYLGIRAEWIGHIFFDLSKKIDHTTDLITEGQIVDDKLFGGYQFNDEVERHIRILLKEAQKNSKK